MSITLEHQQAAPAEAEQPVRLVDTVENALTKAAELPDDEVERRFSILTGCAERIQLPGYVATGKTDELTEAIPNIKDLINQTRDTALEILEKKDRFDDDPVLLVNSLGIAADVTGDPEIIDQTLEAIQDTKDYNLEPLIKALSLAKTEKVTYTQTMRKLKAASTVLAATSQTPQLTTLEQPRDLDVDHEAIGAYVSERSLTPDHEAKYPSIRSDRVQIGNYDDLFASNGTRPAPVDPIAYTGANIEEINAQLPLKDRA